MMRRQEVVAVLLFLGFGLALLITGTWGSFSRSGGRDRVPVAAPVSTARSGVIPPTTEISSTPIVAPSEAAVRRPALNVSPLPAVADLPAVLDLVACDATVDCGGDAAQTAWIEVTACLRTTSEGSNRPLVLVVTGRDAPPDGLNDPWVFARSNTIRGTEAFTCHPVRSVGAPLIRREYWLWVLADSVVLRQLRFTLAR